MTRRAISVRPWMAGAEKAGRMVGRCRLKPVEPRTETAWFQRLKLKCDESLLRFALNFCVRRYSKAASGVGKDIVRI